MQFPSSGRSNYFARPNVVSVLLFSVIVQVLELLLHPLPVAETIGSRHTDSFGVLPRVALKQHRTHEKLGARHVMHESLRVVDDEMPRPDALAQPLQEGCAGRGIGWGQPSLLCFLYGRAPTRPD